MKKMLAATLVLALLICCSFAYADEAEYKELKKGSKGEEVRQLQERLVELGYLTGKADGSYGNKTKEAVELFQVINTPYYDAIVDGIADVDTQVLLFNKSAKKASTKEFNDINYDGMMRNPDDYWDKNYNTWFYYKFKGRVIQVITDNAGYYNDDTAIRVATKGKNGDIVYIEVDSWITKETRLLEGDTITFYTRFTGVESFQTVLGANTYLPTFRADAISFS